MIDYKETKAICKRVIYTKMYNYTPYPKSDFNLKNDLDLYLFGSIFGSVFVLGVVSILSNLFRG